MKTIEYADKYWSVWSDYKERIGQKFVVIREMNEDEYDKESVGKMFLIKFEDGQEISAYPEEVVKEHVDALKKAIIERGYDLDQVAGSGNFIVN